MVTHKANPNSSYGTRYQHTALYQTRGTITGSGSGSVFLIAKSDEEVTCKTLHQGHAVKDREQK